MEKLREIPFEELPTVKKVLERIEQEDRSVSYPAAERKLYDQGLEYIKSHRVQWVESIEACLLQRLKTHAPELELLTYAITILATHGWEQSHDPSFAHAALDSVCQRFRIPHYTQFVLLKHLAHCSCRIKQVREQSTPKQILCISPLPYVSL